MCPHLPDNDLDLLLKENVLSTRILIAGFQHETNTFAPTKANYASFEHGEGFPSMVRGDDLLALRQINVPAGGFILAAERRGWSLLPVIWAGASPSAHVTEDAFERIADEIVAQVRIGGFSAVYLDLHGAMVTEHEDDGEGALLERIRAVVGPDVPVVASLDLHGNVTEKMLREADMLVAYRTYPHVDMAATGERAAALLAHLLDTRSVDGRQLRCAMRRLPFLIPINAMCTLMEPARTRTLNSKRSRLMAWYRCPSHPAFRRRISPNAVRQFGDMEMMKPRSRPQFSICTTRCWPRRPLGRCRSFRQTMRCVRPCDWQSGPTNQS